MKKFNERQFGNNTQHHYDFWDKWSVIEKFIPKKGNIILLDFGCGPGIILKLIYEKNPSGKYIGLDVSSSVLERARKIFPEGNFYEINDGEKLPLEDNSVDFIFSSEVIEHVYDTENAVSEMCRILKPAGKLLLTTPYHGFIKNLLIIIFSFNKHFSPTDSHVRFFTKKTLFNLLKKYSFEIEKYGYYGRFWPVPHSIYVLAYKNNIT